jgi:hypothetical protein
MDGLCSRISTGMVLGVGLLLVWVLAASRPAVLQASAGDHSGDSIVTTGPVIMQYDQATRSPMPLDALYFLDYKGARLLATIPSYRQMGRKTNILHGFAERDLVADFKLDNYPGAIPHFLMTTGSLGQHSQGWAPLFVFETSTNQVAVYRMDASMTAGSSAQSRLELVEIQSYTKAEKPTR